jgi:hypothetical protein
MYSAFLSQPRISRLATSDQRLKGFAPQDEWKEAYFVETVGYTYVSAVTKNDPEPRL